MNPAFSAGSPPMTIRRTSTSGTPRKMSVYTTATTRTGTAARPGSPRTTAMQKCEDENERLGDDHQLDVGLEPVPDLGHRAEEVERAEERVQELPHARPPSGD